MDIGQWLNGVGLGRYDALFREHEIDAEVLPGLTEADLEVEAEAERLPMTTRRIRGARKGAGWISGVRLDPEPAPAVRWRPIARTRASAGRSGA